MFWDSLDQFVKKKREREKEKKNREERKRKEKMMSNCCRPRQIDEELSDHEEEFYYTEIEDGESDDLLEMKMSHAEAQMSPAVESEVKASLSDNNQSYANYQAGANDPNAGLMTSSPPTLSHMDMARPPHEGEYLVNFFLSFFFFCRDSVRNSRMYHRFRSRGNVLWEFQSLFLRLNWN